MADETMIPLLPCTSLEETLGFYRALGFEVTYEQTDPYVYGAGRRGGIDLHYHRPRGQDRKGQAGSCLVFVDDVAVYHRAFADGLRACCGRVPTAGLPRLSRPRKGQTRFTAFDPTGNSLTFIQRDEPPPDYSWYETPKSRLAEVLDKAAASVLDKALARAEPGEPVKRALVLAARAELAVALGDEERARAVRAELRQLPLSEEDRVRHRDEFQAADELERWIRAPRYASLRTSASQHSRGGDWPSGTS